MVEIPFLADKVEQAVSSDRDYVKYDICIISRMDN